MRRYFASLPLLLAAACSGGRGSGSYQEALSCQTQVTGVYAMSAVLGRMGQGSGVDLSRERNVAENATYLAGGKAGKTYEAVTNDILAANDAEKRKLQAIPVDQVTSELARSIDKLDCLKQLTGVSTANGEAR